MTLQTNQIYLYSVTTAAFYTEQEQAIQNEINCINYYDRDVKKMKSKIEKYNKLIDSADIENLDELKAKLDNEVDKLETLKEQYKNYMKNYKDSMKKKDIIEKLKSDLKESFNNNKSVRVLDKKKLHKNNIIGQFESTSTRTLGIEKDSITEDFIVVEVYYEQVLKQLIENGFDHDNERYVFLYCSSGQIRTKRVCFIKESKLEQYQNQLFMGITKDSINQKLGGFSINKYIAYLALTNSSSVKWEEFKETYLEKSIVVEDFIHILKDRKVEHINAKYKIDSNAVEDIELNAMDGCGIMLPTVSKQNMQIRGAGGFKGLLSPFDFKEFINVNGGSAKIKDIYGKEYDIIEDDIQIIFTRSQFKFNKMFDSWKDYKDKFKEFDCEFAIAAKESLDEKDFTDKPLNYQMFQTLIDVDKKELKQLVSLTNERIESVGDTVEDALFTLGAVEDNTYKRPIQKALLVYNELLNDSFVKKQLKDKKSKLVKAARSGGIVLNNNKRMYIIPDLYAFCEWLFKGEQSPEGLLKDGQVSCQLYDNKKLDVLRSPHLNVNEHAIRNNIVNDEITQWFTTKGIYVSIHDDISKIIMCDWDGDEALVVADELFVSIAERHSKGMKSLSYELGVSQSEPINNTAIYNALSAAYKMNIGEVSNAISKILNRDEVDDEAIEYVKLATYFSNQIIDYAKTLWLATMPEDVEGKFKKLENEKLPHFFKFAKNKKRILKSNTSTMNKLANLISSKRINFKFEGMEKGEFDYKVLMSDSEEEVNEEVVESFKELTRYTNIKNAENADQGNEQFYIIKYIRDKMKEVEPDINKVVNSLVKALYEAGTENKQYLWDCYGFIMLENLEFNKGIKHKCVCGTLYEKEKKNQRYCSDKCSIKQKRIKARERKAKQRELAKLNSVS